MRNGRRPDEYPWHADRRDVIFDIYYVRELQREAFLLVLVCLKAVWIVTHSYSLFSRSVFGKQLLQKQTCLHAEVRLDRYAFRHTCLGQISDVRRPDGLSLIFD